MKKLAVVASAAVALICAASLVATPADAKRHAKKPAAAPTTQTAGMGMRHEPGGPMKSGKMCWKDKDPWANTGQGYWAACPK